MATVPQVPKQRVLAMDEEGNYVLPDDHRLPGWTVDALLADGEAAEARAELERLIGDGVDSGPSVEATPEFWDRRYARARGDRTL